VELQGVAAESCRSAGDGRGSAADRACDLAVCGTGLELSSDAGQECGSFEVVGGGEGLAGEGAAAGVAAKARNNAAALRGIGAVVSEAVAGLRARVLGALTPGAEAGAELLQALDGGARLVHAICKNKRRATMHLAPSA